MATYTDRRFFPQVIRTRPLVDQANLPYPREESDRVYDNSPYNVYHGPTGGINKGLPLTYRPPFGRTFPGAIGRWDTSNHYFTDFKNAPFQNSPYCPNHQN
jgi:hypothetical protein